MVSDKTPHKACRIYKTLYKQDPLDNFFMFMLYALDFSECCCEEVTSFFWRSVYISVHLTFLAAVMSQNGFSLMPNGSLDLSRAPFLSSVSLGMMISSWIHFLLHPKSHDPTGLPCKDESSRGSIHNIFANKYSQEIRLSQQFCGWLTLLSANSCISVEGGTLSYRYRSVAESAFKIIGGDLNCSELIPGNS